MGSAVRFDAAADRLLRTSSLPNYNGLWSACLWYLQLSDLNAFGSIFQFDTNDSSLSANEDQLGLLADGTTLNTYVNNGAGFDDANSIALALNTWYFFAVVRESATALRTYVNGFLSTTNARDVTSRTAATRLEMGASYTANTQRVDARIANPIVWSGRALTALQVYQQMGQFAPVVWENLYNWDATPPGADRVKDISGNGNDWTEGGTLTDEEGPPVRWIEPRRYWPGVLIPGTVLTAQYAFRFYNDDAAPATATALAAENANLSIAVATNFQARTGIDTTGDLPSTQFQVEWRKQGDPASEWRAATT